MKYQYLRITFEKLIQAPYTNFVWGLKSFIHKNKNVKALVCLQLLLFLLFYEYDTFMLIQKKAHCKYLKFGLL